MERQCAFGNELKLRVVDEPVPQQLICSTWKCRVQDCNVALDMVDVPKNNFVLVKKHLLSHLYKKDDSIHVQCPVCVSWYHKYKSLSRHLLNHEQLFEFNLKSLEVPDQSRCDSSGYPARSQDQNLTEQILQEDIDEDAAAQENVEATTSKFDEECPISLRNRLIETEKTFYLDMMAKHLSSQEMLDDTFWFCNAFHDQKMRVIEAVLNEELKLCDNPQVFQKAITIMKQVDTALNLQQTMSTSFKRKTNLKEWFNFIEPEKVMLSSPDVNGQSFYYFTPISVTLERVMENQTLRSYILKQNHSFCQTGEVYQGFNLKQESIMLRIYCDAYGTNNALGSAAVNDKILGVYFSPFVDKRICSQRNTIFSVCVIQEDDAKVFGLNHCLQELIHDVQNLVERGFYLKSTGFTYPVRLLSVLSDNLEANKLSGLRANFSGMEMACRKCYCKRSQLMTAKNYDELHGQSHTQRTVLTMADDAAKCATLELNNHNGVFSVSPFSDVQYFNPTRQIPFCYGHDVLEGALKTWLFIFFDRIVKLGWVTWPAIERSIQRFPYKRKDAGSRPAPQKDTKLKKNPFLALFRKWQR